MADHTIEELRDYVNNHRINNTPEINNERTTQRFSDDDLRRILESDTVNMEELHGTEQQSEKPVEDNVEKQIGSNVLKVAVNDIEGLTLEIRESFFSKLNGALLNNYRTIYRTQDKIILTESHIRDIAKKAEYGLLSTATDLNSYKLAGAQAVVKIEKETCARNLYKSLTNEIVLLRLRDKMQTTATENPQEETSELPTEESRSDGNAESNLAGGNSILEKQKRKRKIELAKDSPNDCSSIENTANEVNGNKKQKLIENEIVLKSTHDTIDADKCYSEIDDSRLADGSELTSDIKTEILNKKTIVKTSFEETNNDKNGNANVKNSSADKTSKSVSTNNICKIKAELDISQYSMHVDDKENLDVILQMDMLHLAHNNNSERTIMGFPSLFGTKKLHNMPHRLNRKKNVQKIKCLIDEEAFDRERARIRKLREEINKINQEPDDDHNDDYDESNYNVIHGDYKKVFQIILPIIREYYPSEYIPDESCYGRILQRLQMDLNDADMTDDEKALYIKESIIDRRYLLERCLVQ